MKRAWKLVTVYGVIILLLLVCLVMGNEAVTTMSENRPIERTHCIVIDPGHGGEDGGAVSCHGLPESTYNLEISRKLNDLINLLGYETKMIRTSDVSVYVKGETVAQRKTSDLKERVRMIGETENAVLLSIHQNHFPDERYSGAQVFYAKTEGSEKLAKQLQSVFVSVLNPWSKREAKKSSGIYLMEHIKCPAILIECGFLSNIEEEHKLRDPKYQKDLCIAIACVTSQYLSNT